MYSLVFYILHDIPLFHKVHVAQKIILSEILGFKTYRITE